MLKDIPRIELMNQYRILATDQNIIQAKNEMSQKSNYRQRILERNTVALHSEESQVKKLQQSYFTTVSQLEKAKQKLESLRKGNR